MSKADLFVKPNPQPQLPATFIPSGIDSVIWFDCPVEECLRRADGRRFWNDLTYHVDDRQPPTNAAPLCEMLRPLSDDSNMVNTLADRYIAFDQTTNSLKRWLNKFGDEEADRNLLYVVDANQSVDKIRA